MNPLLKQMLDQVTTTESEKKEEYLKRALDELISRGLIEVEETRAEMPGGLSWAVDIKLVPKEFEYIKKIEKENETLKAELRRIEHHINHNLDTHEWSNEDWLELFPEIKPY